MSAIAAFTSLESLHLNSIRGRALPQLLQSTFPGPPLRPEAAMASEFAAILPRLTRLRSLSLDMDEHTADNPPLPQGLVQTRTIAHGLPLGRIASALPSLPLLSCLSARGNALTAADASAHLAACSRLTQIAILWNGRQAALGLSSAAWAASVNALTALVKLEVDFAGAEPRERMSLLAGSGAAAAAPASAAALASASRAVAAGKATGASEPRPEPRLGALRSLVLARCASPDLVLSAGWCGGLTRLELREAGEHVTAALVAQVCSRLPGLRVLDVSRSFRSRARFQLPGDLLVRDLAVLAPQLERLYMYDVLMHGSGLPDVREFPLLPYIAPAAIGAAGQRQQPRVAHEAPGTGSRVGQGPSTSAGAATPRLPPPPAWARRGGTAAGGGGRAPAGQSVGGGVGGAGGPEAVQEPFPRLAALVVHGSVWMKSRFRAIAHLRGLRELHITGMSTPDFLAACKMSGFDAFTQLTALTALHVRGRRPEEHASGAAAAAAAVQGAGAAALGAAWLPALGPLGVGGGGLGGGGAAGGGGGGGGAGGGARCREPHLNFISELTSLRALTLETLVTRGLCLGAIARLSGLTSLALGGAIDLHPSSLQGFRHATLPRLACLQLLGCQWESMDAKDFLACLPSATPALAALRLGACPGLTPQRLAALLPPLTRLAHVTLHAAPPATAAAVQQSGLAAAAPALRFLALLTTSPETSLLLARRGEALEPVAGAAASAGSGTAAGSGTTAGAGAGPSAGAAALGGEWEAGREPWRASETEGEAGLV